MSENPFVLQASEYKRDLNLVEHYLDQSATYLSKMTGRDIDQCRTYVKQSLSTGGKFEITDPVIHHTERAMNGDRSLKQSRLLGYLKESIQNEELIAPTLTTYIHPEKKTSRLVKFIDNNIAVRDQAKKAMFEAEMAKNVVRQIVMKNVQGNKKISNNSLSGSHVSKSTPLSNKTAHSTLTSTCRATSGYGNANNEKFLCGNRHYFSIDIIRNNIVSIITNTNYASLEEVMAKYQLHYPTVEETMQCIRYSALMYWRDESGYQQLAVLVATLTELERAAFVYTGDLYHLMQYNPEVVRTFLGRLSTYVNFPHPDPETVMKTTSEEIHNLATQICPDRMKGKTIKKVKGTEDYAVVASIVANIANTLQEYKDLIRALWVTKNVPASVANFPSSIRRSALVSDTDSTIFTVQDWVKWYCGKITFNQEAMGVSASIIFLAASTISHILARMSANFGIEEKRIFQIMMKNEFKFDVFVPTQVAKHYYALIGCAEGNLYENYKEEIKGVHLKSSNAPKSIMKQAKQMMLDIMYKVLNEEKISATEFLSKVGAIERNILESVKKGNYEFLRLSQIKEAESYTKEKEESPYQQYTLWNDVFGPKYGMVPPPPYTSIKVSTVLDSPVRMKEWLAGLEDQELSARMLTWLTQYKKDKITTFHLPDQIVSSTGLPDEIFKALNTRKIVHDATAVFYVLGDSLGLFMLNKRKTKLFYDLY